MSIELSMLDKAERGESHEDLVQQKSGRNYGKNIHSAFEQTAQPQPTMAQARIEDLERASGPHGLARVKDYDRRFGFYPSFSVERSLCLEFRAQCISKLSSEIRTLMGDMKSENASEHSSFAPTSVHTVEERLEELMSRLVENLAQYDAAWAHAKMVDNGDAPEETSLAELRIWLDQRSSDQIELYRNKEWHDFRMLAPAKGPIEKLVKAIMPLSTLGRIILRPFRSRSVEVDNLHFLRYEDAPLSWVVSVLLLVSICVFLVLPLALLSYFDTNRNVRMALVLVMCFLISVFARVIEADEARQIVFVCVYSAVMSGFLSQLS